MPAQESQAWPFCQVCTIQITPGRMDDAMACIGGLAKLIEDNEPGVKIYRFFKTEGKDEIVITEKFESRQAHEDHISTDYIRQWGKKYYYSDIGIFASKFEFHSMSKSDNAFGGFERL